MQSDNLLEEAVASAARKRMGQLHKGTKLPYIVHPMEAAAVSFQKRLRMSAIILEHVRDAVRACSAIIESRGVPQKSVARRVQYLVSNSPRSASSRRRCTIWRTR